MGLLCRARILTISYNHTIFVVNEVINNGQLTAAFGADAEWVGAVIFWAEVVII